MELKKLVSLALTLGASEAEVYGSKGRIITVETREGDIGFAEESMSEGAGIRVIVNGAEGYSSSNDPKRMEDAVKAAVDCAKARPKDPHLKSLPAPKPYKTARGMFDSAIDEVKLDRCMELAAVMLEGAKKDKGASVTFGKLVCVSAETSIVSSTGIEAFESETMANGFTDVIIKENGNVSTGFDYDVGRRLDMDFGLIGERASGIARKSLGSVETYDQTADILLGPFAFADILEPTLLFSVSSENVQKGRSGLSGKIGQKIAVDGLTIVDDGLMEGGLGSSSFDDEGCPSRSTAIVDDGILKSYLYDTYTAGKENRESTGNAVRGSYAMPPKVGPRNIRFEYPRSDVVREMDSGIYVNSIIGGHTANPVSGDFSVECRNAFLVENGELTKPVRSMMLAGNVFSLLGRIDGMSREERVVGAAVVPTVKVKGMRVTHGA